MESKPSESYATGFSAVQTPLLARFLCRSLLARVLFCGFFMAVFSITAGGHVAVLWHKYWINKSGGRTSYSNKAGYFVRFSHMPQDPSVAVHLNALADGSPVTIVVEYARLADDIDWLLYLDGRKRPIFVEIPGALELGDVINQCNSRLQPNRVSIVTRSK